MRGLWRLKGDPVVLVVVLALVSFLLAQIITSIGWGGGTLEVEVRVPIPTKTIRLVFLEDNMTEGVELALKHDIEIVNESHLVPRAQPNSSARASKP